MREIVLDTETTGVDPYSGHRIVEIGCIELHGTMPTGKHFHVYLNPERDMPEEAFRVHGLSGDFLKDKPLFSEVVDAFMEFIGDSQLVIHNAQFDMRFINTELERLGFSPLPMSRSIDTVQMARRKFPGSPASLDALCRRFEIDLSARSLHGALLDAQLLADVYLELTGGRQALLDLQRDKVQPVLPGDEQVPRKILEARSFPVSPQELEAHASMLAGMKNPLWNN
ncbi:MAG: DNA polymerase III subunit epsilon [Alphaproteobacteria bacterium]